MAVDDVLSPLFPSHLNASTSPFSSLRRSRVVSDTVFNAGGAGVTLTKICQPKGISLTKFEGHIIQFNAHLDIAILHALSQMNRTLQSIRQFEVVLEESCGISTDASVRADLGALKFQFLGDACSEMIAASIDNIICLADDLRTSFSNRCGGNKAGRQQQILSILQSCQNIHIEDPLAQIQPSFLIQSGRPLIMRRDPSWKLFMYLRHCLRWLAFSRRQDLARLPYAKDVAFIPPDLKRIISTIQEKLNDWGYELSEDEVAKLPFLQYCGFFPCQRITTEITTHARIPSISLHTGAVSITVSVSSSGSHAAMDNTFSFGPVYFTYRERNVKTTISTLGIPNVPATSMFPDAEAISTRHYVASVSLDTVQLRIYPNFIIFLQRILPLHGKYFHYPNRKPSQPKPSHNKVFLANSYWDLFVEIHHISMQAAVEGMVAEIGLKDLRILAPMLHDIGIQARPKPFTSANSFMKISQLYSQVRQAQDETNPFLGHDRDTLARIAWEALVMHMTYRVEGEASPVLHGAISVNSLVVSVPRSALLTYKLVEEWRTQYLP